MPWCKPGDKSFLVLFLEKGLLSCCPSRPTWTVTFFSKKLAFLPDPACNISPALLEAGPQKRFGEVLRSGDGMAVLPGIATTQTIRQKRDHSFRLRGVLPSLTGTGWLRRSGVRPPRYRRVSGLPRSPLSGATAGRDEAEARNVWAALRRPPPPSAARRQARASLQKMRRNAPSIATGRRTHRALRRVRSRLPRRHLSRGGRRRRSGRSAAGNDGRPCPRRVPPCLRSRAQGHRRRRWRKPPLRPEATLRGCAARRFARLADHPESPPPHELVGFSPDPLYIRNIVPY